MFLTSVKLSCEQTLAQAAHGEAESKAEFPPALSCWVGGGLLVAQSRGERSAACSSAHTSQGLISFRSSAPAICQPGLGVPGTAGCGHQALSCLPSQREPGLNHKS